jgi:glutathione S-transferase
MAVHLHNYRYSVYGRIARMALAEKGVAYEPVEINPFVEDLPPSYLALHPFGRVPTLVHDGFVVFETAAITRYVDEAFPGPPLQPDTVGARARMAQIIAVIDSYGYWPLVRQVFSHRVFGPRLGEQADEQAIRDGLQASPRVLQSLEGLADEAAFLLGDRISLADIHLAPMIAYFAQAPEGADLLARQRKLAAWWDRLAVRPSMVATDPGLPEHVPAP